MGNKLLDTRNLHQGGFDLTLQPSGLSQAPVHCVSRSRTVTSTGDYIDPNTMCPCSMCLFVQSQEFHRHTELMINNLHGAAQHAAGQLAGIDASLTEQHSQLHSMAATVKDVGAQQQQLADDVAQTAEGVTALQDNTAALADAMAESLRHEVSRDAAQCMLPFCAFNTTCCTCILSMLSCHSVSHAAGASHPVCHLKAVERQSGRVTLKSCVLSHDAGCAARQADEAGTVSG